MNSHFLCRTIKCRTRMIIDLELRNRTSKVAANYERYKLILSFILRNSLLVVSLAAWKVKLLRGGLSIRGGKKAVAMRPILGCERTRLRAALFG